MKVSELFEAVEKDIGTLEVTGDGDTLTVKCTAKSGPMLSGLYWIWKDVGSKKGVKTLMNMVTQRFGAARPVELTKNDGLKILDKRPTKLTFVGVDRAELQTAVDKAIAKVQKEIKSNAKYKADAPKRKAEASKYQAEKRKKDLGEYEKKYGKGTWGRVTYKQEGGDDGYAYVVRVDGRAKWNGLTQREAMHYKEREVDALAKAAGLGKYAETVKEGLVSEDTSGEYGIYRKETYTATKNGGGFKKGDEIYVTSAMYAPDYRVIVNNPDGEADVDDIPCTYADLKAAGIVGEPASRGKAGTYPRRKTTSSK